MTGVEGLTAGSMVRLVWRVAGEGMGLLYARRAMSVKPATRIVRSAIVVREREVSFSEGGRALRTDSQYMGAWVPVCRGEEPWLRL